MQVRPLHTLISHKLSCLLYLALSFLLPLITLLVRTTKPLERTSPKFLVLAPTRELAMQIENQAKQLMRGKQRLHT